MSARRPTNKDLAEASGVSLATVDRVINGRKFVRQSTAVRVFEAAKKLGFHATPLLQQRVAKEAPNIVFGLVLLSTEGDFYASFKEHAEQVASEMNVRLIVDFLPSQNPQDVVAALERMASKAHAIGLVSIDHPTVTEEVVALGQRGIPVFALLSDFAQGVRTAYIGTDNMKVGRTAASMLARAIPRHGPSSTVALFVGSHRWHGHDLRETGFRAWFRQNRPDVEVLETVVNLDIPELTYEATLSLIARYPTLAGIFCAGGGREGVITAVRDEKCAGRIEIVANEYSELTRRAMSEGIVALVIGTPVREIMTHTYSMALAALGKGPGKILSQQFVPMQLVLPESM